VERVIHALLKAEIAAKQARSINYQLGVAKISITGRTRCIAANGKSVPGPTVSSRHKV